MARERRWGWGRLRLSTQILLLQLAIIVLTLGTGVVVSILQARAQLDRESGKQSLAIARTVSQIPELRAAFGTAAPGADHQSDRRADPGPDRRRPSSSSRTSRASATPTPTGTKIGQRISTDPSEALLGREYVGVQTGSLGRSMRAKVPVRDQSGRRDRARLGRPARERVSAQLRNDLPVLLIPPRDRARARRARLDPARAPDQAADVRPRAGRDLGPARAARGGAARNPRRDGRHRPLPAA